MFRFFRTVRSSSDTRQTPKGTVNHISPSFTHPVPEPDVPEGGVEAWCTVIGGFLAQFCGFGYLNAFGVFQAFYAQHYLENESSSAISWIGSLAVFLVTAIGSMGGPLFDNGYFYHVFIGGAVLQSIAIFTLSLVQPGRYYQVLITQGLVWGIGQGLMYTPSFAVLSHHFKRRRPAMMAVVSSGASLGGVVNTIMLNRLLNGPIGFRTGVRISAGFLTILLFLSCVLARPRYRVVHHETTNISFWNAAKKCFMEMPSLLTIVGFMLFQVAFSYPYFYFQLDSLQHGLDASFAFYSLVILNASGFVWRFSTGFVLRFIRIVDLAIFSAAVCGILIICMIWLGTVASVIVLGVLYGMFSGIGIALMAPMLGLTSDPAELGARIGVGSTIVGIGGLVGTPISGALLTGRYVWWRPAVFCGAAMLVASASFIGVRFSLGRFAATRERHSDQLEGNGETLGEGG